MSAHRTRESTRSKPGTHDLKRTRLGSRRFYSGTDAESVSGVSEKIRIDLSVYMMIFCKSIKFMSRKNLQQLMKDL